MMCMVHDGETILAMCELWDLQQHGIGGRVKLSSKTIL